MSATGGDIIKLKDAIHTKWFELQRSKRSNGGHAFLSKPIYDEIVRLGHEALSTLQEIDPDSRFIKRIQKPLHETQWKSWVAEDIGYIGPTPYYVMTPERGQNVITQDINRLANEIHHAGMSLIKSSAQYCGCEISEEVKDLSSINTGVLQYCKGALKRGDRRAWVHEPGDSVEHRPGSATNHANTVKFVPTEAGCNIEMVYTESGDENWRARQRGVIDFIEMKGGRCEDGFDDPTRKCHIENASDDDILDLALMVSQLKDIDLLNYDCIPLAFELIAEQAEELKETEPKENIWRTQWTRAKYMERMEDCNRGDRRREPRETLRRRLVGEIEWLSNSIDLAVRASKEQTCTTNPYSFLSRNYQLLAIRENCNQIKTETDDPWDWCVELADLMEEQLRDAAKDLVKRCPPEGIILATEAQPYPLYDLSNIEEVCKLAENQDCLDIIRQVEAREKADIKPGKLELKFMEEANVPA